MAVHLPWQVRRQLPPVQLKLHVAPDAQISVQLPPLHDAVQFDPDWQTRLQLPAEQESSHVLPEVQSLPLLLGMFVGTPVGIGMLR